MGPLAADVRGPGARAVRPVRTLAAAPGGAARAAAAALRRPPSCAAVAGAWGTGADGSRAGTDAPIIAGRAGRAQAQAMRCRSATSSALSSAR